MFYSQTYWYHLNKLQTRKLFTKQQRKKKTEHWRNHVTCQIRAIRRLVGTAEPISIRKARPRKKKKPNKPPKLCLPCLIIISLVVLTRINKPFICSRCVICVSWSRVFRDLFTWFRRTTCAKNHGPLFILIGTHKSTRLEDLITWFVCLFYKVVIAHFFLFLVRSDDESD